MKIFMYQNFLRAYQMFRDKADIATKKIAEAMRMQWSFLNNENESVEITMLRNRAVKKAVELLLAFNHQAKTCGCPFLRAFVRKEDIVSCSNLLNEIFEATIFSIHVTPDVKEFTKGVEAFV